jgi:acetyl-CoA synthetase
MKAKFIKEKLKYEPNLKNYNKAYKEFSVKKAEKELEWFKGKKLNVGHNAIDRHANSWRRNKIGLYWEGDSTSEKYTFQELKELSNKVANVLEKHGIKKGTRVFLFCPRIPELYYAFIGIVKTGAIAGTLFAAFGEQAIRDRLGDSEAYAVITHSSLKDRIYKVKKHLPNLKKIIVVDEAGKGEIDLHKEISKASSEYKVKHMNPEDPAFMLYTSGTTGKPKGVVHCHYALVSEHLTAKYVLDLKEDDVYWCTADPGWVTGIAYGILGPWSNGVSQLVHGGRFSVNAWYSLIEKYKVNVWYTAPTAVRMLMKTNDHKKFDLSSVRHACSVGEPLNPEAVVWAKKELGILFHDTWWQTETGAMMMVNLPCNPIKVGYMGKPFLGIKPLIVDDKGKDLGCGVEGNLAFKPGWPSMMRKVWKRPSKYKSYFTKGLYMSGDRAIKDKDGYFLFVGRADDVIKTAGHRVGPYEVESALVEHPAIIEAGVIGKPDKLFGQIIKAFVVLKPGYKFNKQLDLEIRKFIKKNLAGHAYPKEIEVVKYLPKTRSGKIMRRLLKAKELGLDLGDTSTVVK